MGSEIALLSVALAAFFWGGFVTPVAIGLANRFHILDAPGGRKVHSKITPRGAGLGIWLGYLVLCLYYVTPADGDAAFVPYAATGATLVFFSGYMDDMKSLPALFRLMIHLLAAALALFTSGLPPFSYFIVVVWIAGVTSAYNLIDGVNGLCLSLFIASSSALFLTGYAGAAGAAMPFGPAVTFGAALAAMALGTMCWNFPKAQTFLGDGGSTLLGFIFSAHAAESMGAVFSEAPFHELMLLLVLFGGVPVLDTAFAFSRRIMSGKSPFTPDRAHLHHRLADMGLPLFWVVILIMAIHALLLYVGALALAILAER